MANTNKTPPDIPFHHWEKTQDGSFTLYSEKYQQHCHSTAGAKSETHWVYFHQCELEAKAKEKNLSILEVGLGTGLGPDQLEEFWQQKAFTHFCHIISLEIDEHLVNHYVQNKDCHILFQDSKIIQWQSLKTSNFLGTIILGNARQSIHLLPSLQATKNILPFDAIFMDAFSPKANPELWTVEWFSDLRKLSYTNTIMSTYSASKQARKAMLEAGWAVHRARGFAQKKECTIAKGSGPSDQTLLEALARSPLSAYRD